MSGSSQNSDDQQSQANEQSNSQSQKKEINWDKRKIQAEIIIGIGTIIIGLATVMNAFWGNNLRSDQNKLKNIQNSIDNQFKSLKSTRDQTQLEFNVMNFSFDRLFNCPQNDEDFYKKLTLVKVLGQKFNRSIVQQSGDDKNLVILMLDEVKIDIEQVKEYCPNFENDLSQPQTALDELKKERNTAVENIKWSLFKVDIAYIHSCKETGKDAQKYLYTELRKKGFKPYAIKRHTDEQLNSSYWSNFFKQETNKVNQVIYQEAPIDETEAANLLKELLTSQREGQPPLLSDVKVEKEDPYQNVIFTDPATGEEIQIITIAIGNCNENTLPEQTAN